MGRGVTRVPGADGYAPAMPNFRPGNWPFLAIGGLVVLNAVLLVALFSRQSTYAVPDPPTSSVVVEPAAPPSVRPSPSQPSSPEPSPSSSPSPSGAPHQQQDDGPAGADRLLAVGSDRLGWRAVRGSCADRPEVEVSTDGGRTWRRTRPGVAALSRLKSYDERSVFAIGADARCRPSFAWAAATDRRWQQDAARAGDVWFRLPGDPDRVHAPGGRRTTPCSTGLSDLAGLGTYQAAALCRDGRIRTTDDGGSWTTVLKASGGRALNADDDEFVVAKTVPSCAGLVVQRFDVTGAGLAAATPRCHRSASPSAPVAVAIGPSTTWLWSGDDITVF